MYGVLDSRSRMPRAFGVAAVVVLGLQVGLSRGPAEMNNCKYSRQYDMRTLML